MDIKNIIWHSRASAESDWRCQRARYYLYNYEGGIVKDNLTLPLFIGNCIHDGVAGIATQSVLNGAADIDTIATDANKLVYETLKEYYYPEVEFPKESAEWLLAMEQSTLVEAVLRGFYRLSWPAIFAKYPNFFKSETETIFPHDSCGKLNKKGPFVYKAKPDLVLAGEDGLLYFEIKSTSSKKPEWVTSWNYAPQVHGTAKAIEFTYGKDVLGTIIQGFYKGYSQYGKYSSVLVYGYAGKGNPPFTKVTYSPDYRAGLKRTPVWEMEGGVKMWIEKLPLETLSEQFPQTPLIPTNEGLAEDFFRQRAIREQDVKIEAAKIKEPSFKEFKQLSLDTFFPQSFSQCSPSFGSPCEFLNICHGTPQAKEDPLNHGFAKRDREHNDGYKILTEQLLG